MLSVAGIVDEAQNGPRIVRRLVRRERKTVNVVARAGDPGAERTLVVLAHHDAAQTGALFDQTLQRKAYDVPALADRGPQDAAAPVVAGARRRAR